MMGTKKANRTNRGRSAVDANGQPLRGNILYQIIGTSRSVGYAYCSNVDEKNGEEDLIAIEFYSSGAARTVNRESLPDRSRRYQPAASLDLRRARKLIVLKRGADKMAYMFRSLCRRAIGDANMERIEESLEWEELDGAMRH